MSLNASAREQLRLVLQDWSQSVVSEFGDNLVAIIHFGSTSKDFVKLETDVDLLVVFETTPKNRMEKFRMIEPVEAQLTEKLKVLKGYSLIPSVLAWQRQAFEKLHPLYLDFIDASEIIYDPYGVAKTIIDKTAHWVQKVGAKKVQVGGLWYWDVNPTRKKEFNWSFDD